MFKKICALILLVCMVLSVVPTYAAIPISTDGILDDLDYIDDVRKYDMDLFEKEETVDRETEAAQTRAVTAVLSLGIMKKNNEGKFLPDENVLLGDFASIVLKLLSGSDVVTEEWYANYDPSQFTTQSIAAKYIVSALGYSVYERKYDTAYPEMSVASELKLFKNLKQNPEAYITRMELAQMIYNALSVDLFKQASFGPESEYVVAKGSTLLGEVFGAVEINGTLTAASGVNIYSSVALEKERLAIDEIEYIVENGEDYSELLGKRVFAYARQSEHSALYEILGVMEHERDESFTIPLDKVCSVSKSKIVYEDRGRKNISVDNVDTVLYNGSSMKNFTFSNELLDYEGSILLGKSRTGGAYDIAVVYAMESFPVSRVTSLDKRVYFKYGMKYDGLNYIDLNDEDRDKTVVVIKNGIFAETSDIKADDVISVSKSADGNYVRVLVSNKKITGTIAQITSDGAVVLDSGDSFFIAGNYQDAYDEAMLNGKSTELKEIKLGTSGSFSISTNGRIADIVVGDSPKYALLKEIGTMPGGSSLRLQPAVRVFTIDQVWEIYELSDKLVLDGVSTKKKEAYEKMLEYQDSILMQPIRYKLSDDKKITFLDTMVDEIEEKTDPQRLVLSEIYEGEKIDWTLGLNLRPTNYSIPRTSPMFYLPTDRTDEKKYKVIYSNQLVAEDTPKMSLYSASRFGAISVVLYEGSVYSGSWHGGWIFAVNEVWHKTNEDEEERCVVKGMIRQSTGGGRFWEEVELEITPEALETVPTLSKGDIFLYIKNADGAVDKIDIKVEDAQLPDIDIYQFPGSDPEMASGVVTDVDLAQKMIAVEVNRGTEIIEKIYMVGDICIYDSDQGVYFPAKFQDINIGDRILVSGLVRQVDPVIFR